ncbi:hypothetical protein AB0G54_31845 [Streptomyces yokosukanensis]|uniref:hypothetical protein n=1 Tax=Streptomyces yokosukanensis TaxID=67386 RepID=UPI003425DDC2
MIRYRRLLSIAGAAICLITVAVFAAFAWGQQDNGQQADRNRLKALHEADDTAHDFATRLDKTSGSSLPGKDRIQQLATSLQLGTPVVVRTSSGTSVTFQVNIPYASPGSFSGAAVSECYVVALTTPPRKKVTLTSLSCGKLNRHAGT